MKTGFLKTFLVGLSLTLPISAVAGESLAADVMFGSPSKLFTRGEFKAIKTYKYKEFDKTHEAYLELIIEDASPAFLKMHPLCGRYNFPITQTFRLVSAKDKNLQAVSTTRFIEVDLESRYPYRFTDLFFAAGCVSAMTTFTFSKNFKSVEVDFSRLKERGYYDKLDFKFNGNDIVIEGPILFLRKSEAPPKTIQ